MTSLRLVTYIGLVVILGHVKTIGLMTSLRLVTNRGLMVRLDIAASLVPETELVDI